METALKPLKVTNKPDIPGSKTKVRKRRVISFLQLVPTLGPTKIKIGLVPLDTNYVNIKLNEQRAEAWKRLTMIALMFLSFAAAFVCNAREMSSRKKSDILFVC